MYSKFLGNVLAKGLTFGYYVSSLSPEEKFREVTTPKTGLTSESIQNNDFFEERSLADTWQMAFYKGISQKIKSLIVCEHAVAVKAAIDESGQKFLIVYDSLKKDPQIKIVN
jgi:hypothetical protein